MKTLREFVEEQAKLLPVRESEAARKRDEWIAAVDRLNARVRGWIDEADPDHHVLRVEERPTRLREEGLGTYEVNGLAIALGPREVRLVPVARNVAGPASSTGRIQVSRAFGRVDLTNGIDRLMIFRMDKGPDERWSIIREDDYRMTRFGREEFEEAIQGLLE